MKKTSITLFAMLCYTIGIAQSPESFNYQAVIKNANGEIIANQNLSMQISILQTSSSGASVYTETHQAATNNAGLVNLQIGEGTVVSGNFSTIDWGGDLHFIKIEVDLNAGTNFTEIGTMQLLSVPYALYAKDVQNNDDADADPSNEIQSLAITNNELSISSGNSIIIPEEVEQINPFFVLYNQNNQVETVRYNQFITPLIKALQIQNKEIQLLRKENIKEQN